MLSGLADDEELTDLVWRNSLRAHMAGQLFVRDIELPSVGRELATGVSPDTFLTLPFDEAIAHFEGRGILNPDEFSALSDAEKMRSFTVTRAMSDTLIEKAKTRLNAAMQPEGPGLRDFLTRFKDSVQASDLPGGSRGYLENVYRTTTATSYNAGRYTQQTSPVVAGAGLLWRYVTALDTRVRSDHAALHGKVWPIGDAEAQAVYPPNGYQCRCVMVVVEPEDVTAADRTRRVDVDAAVSEGFRGAPTEALDEGAA